ncbi:MAG: hypothetical protein M0Z65_13130 [Firmicutes bacterium]|uniref:Uncharacterized protein n=1 Tax=Melghirimyces thermohalophilus TaxID=1236220 RepID=A0A1G6KAL2_9BACL|nr:hypothetical protein [Melghirimyces thermohalophilus]MDA8354090.1 hypothetical protein [Bacillota bacterium]SDC28102.1 hypothetical protein SAMN04488112_105156 [Melghirimyces thermohalophilus]
MAPYFEKGEVLILNQKVSASIRKAMFSSHHITYAEYANNLEKRLEVEQKREREYKKAKRLVAETA